MRPSNQTQAVMLIYYRRAPHNFKTIEWKPGGEAFITYNILYHYFINFKNSPKIQKWSDRQKKHKPGGWSDTWCLYEIWKLSD